MAKRITEAVAADLQANASEKDRFVFDTLLSGYALRRTPAGVVIHIAQARVAGRKLRFAAGRWPKMKVAEGRELARSAIADMRAGRNPALERRTRQQASAANGITVQDFAEKWMAEHVQLKLKPKTAADYDLNLHKHVIQPSVVAL